MELRSYSCPKHQSHQIAPKLIYVDCERRVEKRV